MNAESIVTLFTAMDGVRREDPLVMSNYQGILSPLDMRFVDFCSMACRICGKWHLLLGARDDKKIILISNTLFGWSANRFWR